MNMNYMQDIQITGPKSGTPIASFIGGKGQNDGYSKDQIAQIMGVKDNSGGIGHLVRDINKSLDDYVPSTAKKKKKNNDTEDEDDNIDSIDDADDVNSDEEKNNKNKKNNNKKKNMLSNISVPYMLREPLILLVIYVILSQSFVKNAINSYVPYIGNNADGSKTFITIVIYGCILATLFMVVKKILL